MIRLANYEVLVMYKSVQLYDIGIVYINSRDQYRHHKELGLAFR